MGVRVSVGEFHTQDQSVCDVDPLRNIAEFSQKYAGLNVADCEAFFNTKKNFFENYFDEMCCFIL